MIECKSNYTSQLLCYRDEIVFTDCSIREYFDEELQLKINRDINAAINVKRVGLDLFPTINRRQNKVVIAQSKTASQEVLRVFKRHFYAYTESGYLCAGKSLLFVGLCRC
ncbi:MAG: hypothetical protein AB4080_03130 [Trichodesmium sp.]